MSYLGDADVGARTNVGAGTITANYDGKHKNRTTIGEGVFLGVDSMLVAPLTIGDGAKTGAGAVVTRDVPAGKLAVGVPARIRETGRAAEAGPDDPPPEDGARSRPSRLPGVPAPVGVPDHGAPGHRRSSPSSRASSWRPRSPSYPSAGARSISSWTRATGRASGPAAARRPGPLPRRQPARPHLPRLLRLGVRRGQPRHQAPGRSEPVVHESRQPIALVVVTALLALFTIVFGELVPKTLALGHPERFALVLGRPIDWLGRLLGPLVSLLTGLTRAITKALGTEVAMEAQISAEELKLIVERGGEQGILEAEEEQMIHAVIELGQGRVHEVMVPRTAITGLPSSATFEEAIDRIVEEGHSRVPVYESSVDEIIGILYAKDLLPFLKGGSAPRPALPSLLRTPVFVPESMSIDDLLHEFQRRKVHIAIVLDEYGGTAGLVTIEDLLEEIVGEIQDEYDVEEPMVVRLSDDEARVDGRASVDELGELFEIEPRGRGRIRHRRRPRLPPDRPDPQAGRRGHSRRPVPDRRVDRRPAGGQGARRAPAAAT